MPGSALPSPRRPVSPYPTTPAQTGPPQVDFGPAGDGAGARSFSAADFAPELIVRRRGERPTTGWRGALYALTGGRVNPGISVVEAERRHQISRIRAHVSGWHTITVASMKGGVGKTTAAALLGLTLAEHRGDRVIALDANPDAGTLADRLLGRPGGFTVRNLINDLDTIVTLTDVARYTHLAGRLQVLASEQDPAMSESFNKREYEAILEVLKDYYNIIITDSGTGLIHSAMHGALEATRTLVIVGAPTVDGGSRASKTLDWLKAHGHDRLVSNAVVALSCDRVSRDIDRDAVRGHFAARCRAVVEIPDDPHLKTGGHIQIDRLRRSTQAAARSLAAHVADQFAPQPAAPFAHYAGLGR